MRKGAAPSRSLLIDLTPLSFPLPISSHSPLEIGPLKPARGSGKRCKLPKWGLSPKGEGGRRSRLGTPLNPPLSVTFRHEGCSLPSANIVTIGTATDRMCSGVGTNLKKIFWSCPSTFLALKVQLVVLVSSFVMVSTVWSVSCLLLFYLECPRAQSLVQVGGGGSAPWSRRHCACVFLYFVKCRWSWKRVHFAVCVQCNAMQCSNASSCNYLPMDRWLAWRQFNLSLADATREASD